MCGIAGFVSLGENMQVTIGKKEQQVRKMGKCLKHRGPDDFRSYVDPHFACAHTRLAVRDPARGVQPMIKKRGDAQYVLVYNGEVYNAKELRKALEEKGFTFTTNSDTEVVLQSYICYGEKMVERLNGIYSFVIWDTQKQAAFFCRDRCGVKPLFYSIQDGVWVFASEIKALLSYEGIKPLVARDGLQQLFGLGPARLEGSGVYRNIYEILPGHCGNFSASGLIQKPYWRLEAGENRDSYEEAVEKVRYLLTDSIERQLASDVPICTLLSGGLDSSVVSAVAAAYLKKSGKQLDTYSFDYTDNAKNFVASGFQPELDRPYVEQMVEKIGSNHVYLECAHTDLFQCLFEAVDAKDLPGMTDVDASLLYFSKKIKKRHTVCLSGECADEIFGGYPWFRAPESFSINGFPWSRDLEFRKQVLNEELAEELNLDRYVSAQYQKSVLDTSLSAEEEVEQGYLFRLSEEERKQLSKDAYLKLYRRRQRELAHLNVHWFMSTLLERKDRMTMAASLEVRVPFADHRLVSYLYQLPWEFKYHKGIVKSLLKDAMGAYLPKGVVERKKCPYPKTYDPQFEKLLKECLQDILTDPNAPIRPLVNKKYLQAAMQAPSDYGKPWFGQLMALPQMYAYWIQMNYWLTKYHIQLEL